MSLNLPSVYPSFSQDGHGTHVSTSTCVTSINSQKGDVTLDIPQGTVTSVNNISPVSGNVTLPIPQGTVKSVNNINPDSNGNVSIGTIGYPDYLESEIVPYIGTAESFSSYKGQTTSAQKMSGWWKIGTKDVPQVISHFKTQDDLDTFKDYGPGDFYARYFVYASRGRWGAPPVLHEGLTVNGHTFDAYCFEGTYGTYCFLYVVSQEGFLNIECCSGSFMIFFNHVAVADNYRSQATSLSIPLFVKAGDEICIAIREDNIGNFSPGEEVSQDSQIHSYFMPLKS